jgi:hypothetical protein
MNRLAFLSHHHLIISAAVFILTNIGRRCLYLNRRRRITCSPLYLAALGI